MAEARPRQIRSVRRAHRGGGRAAAGTVDGVTKGGFAAVGTRLDADAGADAALPERYRGRMTRDPINSRLASSFPVPNFSFASFRRRSRVASRDRSRRPRPWEDDQGKKGSGGGSS